MTAERTPLSFRAPRTGVIVILLVVIALALRLWELGERAMHHDESLDAWWSWLFRNGGYERYDPVYHGPLRFYITAGFYEIFGESEAIARLFSALTGTAVVGLPWFLRRELGRAGTIAAAVALTISPTMLYYSRFGREDAQMVFLTLLAIVLGLAYLRRPRTATAAGLAFTLACSFAIKESTYLFGLLLAVYLMVIIAAQFDAQARMSRGTADELTAAPDGELGLNRAFFSTGLILATVGLLVAVIIGASADELFPMLMLYMAGLGVFVLAAAMPRLRQAGITWSPAQAAVTLIALAVAAQTVRAFSVEPGVWTASIPALGAGVALVVLAASLLVLPPFNSIAEAGTWALAFGIGAVGLLGNEWIERSVAAGPTNLEWTVSFPALAIGMVVVLGAGAVWLADQLPIELPAAATGARARATAGIILLGGIALVLNEYTESESNRLAAALVIILVLGGIAAGLSALPRTTSRDFEWPPVLRSMAAIGWVGWLITLAVFGVAWYMFFTIFGTVKEDWASGFTRAIDYWDSQQEVNRGGQPWYYYLFALPAYEWFFVLLAGVGTWRSLRRPTIMSGLFVWFAIGSLILYSYAGERMPWLIAHPLLPMLILAGYGIQQLWVNRDHRAMPTIAAACLIGLLFTTGTAWRASFPGGADSREILSQAGQATPHLTAALERLDNIDRLSRQTTGEPATLAIGTANAWPYNWYLRDRGNVLWFTNENGPPDDPTIDVIIADFSAINTLDYPEFQGTLFAMRSWWVPTYTEAGPLGWLNWARGLHLWEQSPNANFIPVREVEPDLGEGGLNEKIGRLQDGAGDASRGFVAFIGADNAVVNATDPVTGTDDGRDGCGSVDQWFLVRNELADLERQVYPAPIATMGPLDCASDSLASS